MGEFTVYMNIEHARDVCTSNKEMQLVSLRIGFRVFSLNATRTSPQYLGSLKTSLINNSQLRWAALSIHVEEGCEAVKVRFCEEHFQGSIPILEDYSVLLHFSTFPRLLYEVSPLLLPSAEPAECQPEAQNKLPNTPISCYGCTLLPKQELMGL